MNSIAQHLFAQLGRYLEADRVVVWYDPRREWEPAFGDWFKDDRSFDTMPKCESVVHG